MIKSNKLDLVSGIQESKEINEIIIKIFGRTKCQSSSVLINPDYFSFSQQRKSEKIILALRPHWVTNHGWVFITLIMLTLPILFLSFDFSFFMPLQYKVVFCLIWYLIVLISAFEKFLSWYFNLSIITTQRVISLSFNNFFNKHFAEVDLNKIQDVSSSVRGVLGTFFNYGDVLVQTASENNQVILKNVCHPDKLMKLLKEIHQIKEAANDSE